jgi:hypothetical protein
MLAERLVGNRGGGILSSGSMTRGNKLALGLTIG